MINVGYSVYTEGQLVWTLVFLLEHWLVHCKIVKPSTIYPVQFGYWPLLRSSPLNGYDWILIVPTPSQRLASSNILTDCCCALLCLDYSWLNVANQPPWSKCQWLPALLQLSHPSTQVFRWPPVVRKKWPRGMENGGLMTTPGQWREDL